MHAVAIVPAAGLGVRLATGGRPSLPKALRPLAGRSILQRSVDALAPYVDEVVVVLPPGLSRPPHLTTRSASLSCVSGGGTRQESVANALATLRDDVDWVLVHDAARALVPADVVRRVLDALRGGATCVVPSIPPADSLRRVLADGGSTALPRSAVRLVQTPQGFTAAALRRGHERAPDVFATDDATLVEAVGESVTLVEGDPLAFKITHPLDLALAEALLRGTPAGC